MDLVDDSESDGDAPPLKRIKTEQTEVEKKPATGEVSRTKYKNSDLPAGCLDGNAWRGILIPTVAHATGGDNVHPWLVEDDVLVPILMKAWKVVYAGRPSLADYPIIPGGAVHLVVCHLAKAGYLWLTP